MQQARRSLTLSNPGLSQAGTFESSFWNVSNLTAFFWQLEE
jgi:hypothetical protein